MKVLLNVSGTGSGELNELVADIFQVGAEGSEVAKKAFDVFLIFVKSPISLYEAVSSVDKWQDKCGDKAGDSNHEAGDCKHLSSGHDWTCVGAPDVRTGRLEVEISLGCQQNGPPLLLGGGERTGYGELTKWRQHEIVQTTFMCLLTIVLIRAGMANKGTGRGICARHEQPAYSDSAPDTRVEAN
jgi:hypothetical protein